MLNPWPAFPGMNPLPWWNAPAVPASSVHTQMAGFADTVQKMLSPAQQQNPFAAGLAAFEPLMRMYSIPASTAPGSGHPFGSMLSASWPPAFDPSAATMPSLPALGIGREYQEDNNDLIALYREYANALTAYQALFYDFSRTVSENFSAELAKFKEPADFETTCRLWIDCAEQAFSELAHTDGYAQKYASLIDTFVKLIAQYKKIQARQAGPFNAPSRDELNQVHQRSAGAREAILKLEQRVAELEQEVRRLQPKKLRPAAQGSAASKTRKE